MSGKACCRRDVLSRQILVLMMSMQSFAGRRALCKLRNFGNGDIHGRLGLVLEMCVWEGVR